tara:strand:- start:10169 stop:10675 length:507 start_codon:yes stop_codon:yes gene_type:complete
MNSDFNIFVNKTFTDEEIDEFKKLLDEHHKGPKPSKVILFDNDGKPLFPENITIHGNFNIYESIEKIGVATLGKASQVIGKYGDSIAGAAFDYEKCRKWLFRFIFIHILVIITFPLWAKYDWFMSSPWSLNGLCSIVPIVIWFTLFIFTIMYGLQYSDMRKEKKKNDN